MALAAQWVARIMAVSVLMVAPGLAGQWLDRWLGTSFLALVGFGIGISSGLGSLLVMTRVVGQKKSGRSVDKDSRQ
jgi:hypothetical protein